jgi:hypothetical protein
MQIRVTLKKKNNAFTVVYPIRELFRCNDAMLWDGDLG